MDTVQLDFPDRDLFILQDGDWRGFRSHPCAKEPETVEWIRSFDEGSVLWDVGASVGPYSLIAAALGHRVHAIEPFAPSYGHLVQNVWLNSLNEISSYPVAFDNGLDEEGSTFAGWDTFHVSNPEPGSASHRETGMTHPAWHCSVDAFYSAGYPDGPNHVKIDVDGGELGVIEGGRETWKEVSSIMIESEPPTIDDITLILQGAGLELVNSWKRMGDTKQHNYLFRRVK